ASTHPPFLQNPRIGGNLVGWLTGRAPQIVLQHLRGRAWGHPTGPEMATPNGRKGPPFLSGSGRPRRARLFVYASRARRGGTRVLVIAVKSPIWFLREGLFAKYVVSLVGLVVFVLAVNGSIETYISYRATKTTLVDAMSEKA